MKFIELITEDERIPYQHTPDHGVITVRRLSMEVRNEIQRKYQKIEHRNGRREVFVPEAQAVEMEMDLWDYIILAWDGVARYGAQDLLPCTREWKGRLPNDIRQGILALADEANVSGLRPASEPVEDPTRA